jgi:2-succinyl-5-enolpyruvyl-6-hydroxy-3-cyclohexene-1-carboxylate synthase
MNTPALADVQAAFCAALVDEWARAGISEAVVSPGSRSSPLVLALDAEPRVRVKVVLDERSAGFVALGIGASSGCPAVVVTTSGTAAAELHPAIVEAFYGAVPLIAATADRPAELHGIGAPQTIEQEGIFAGMLRWAASPGVADVRAAKTWRSIASRSAAEAIGCGGRPGPVHLNLAFAEPLVGAPGALVPPGRPGEQPWHRFASAEASPPAEVVELLASKAGRWGLVIAGAGVEDPDALVAAAARLGWPVLADPRSGCRLPGGPVVAAADSLLRVAEVASWQPELVVRAGAPSASRVVSEWLEDLGPRCSQVVVDRYPRWLDPERQAEQVVRAGPAALMSASALSAPPGSAPSEEWLKRWLGAEQAAQATIALLLEPGGELELSEPAVARAVLASLPPGGQLFAASSMPVRDLEWWGAPRRGVVVLSNRGANGIDGVLSSAFGAALASGAPTVALLGDLAFLHDAGGLGALRAAGDEVAFSAVVIDNNGGGIFSFLPQAAVLDEDVYERYFGTPHGLDLGKLARAYEIEVIEVRRRADLEEVLASAARRGTRVAVVRSDRAANVAAHQRLHRAVAESVRP